MLELIDSENEGLLPESPMHAVQCFHFGLNETWIKMWEQLLP